MTTERSATHVVPLKDFEDHAFDEWERARKAASQGLIEPLQIGSHLEFCRVVDPYGQPMDQCQRHEATFALCTVTVRDLGAPSDTAIWEPLCTQQRRSTRTRRAVR